MDSINHFNQEELQAYGRQIILPEVGVAGQYLLKSASVLVIGAGGLGCPVLAYLAAGGVGKIGIVDGDRIERSNLHRQVIYGEKDIGSNKAEVATEKLKEMYSNADFIPYAMAINRENAYEIMRPYDILVDCSDNFPTRYLVNDAAYFLQKPCVYASVYRFEGQISIFNALTNDGNRSPNYRDMYPDPPAPGQIPDCSEGGVLGVLPGIIGSIQGMEVFKLILGIGNALIGKMLLFNGLEMQSRVIRYGHDPNNPLSGVQKKITELIDYDLFCGVNNATQTTTIINEMVKEVSVTDLKAMMDQGEDFQLIDVREPYEAEIAQIGGTLIPLGDIASKVDMIDSSKKVVIHCRSGARSGNAVRFLQEAHGFENLFNLAGGILAWSDQIDPTVPKY